MKNGLFKKALPHVIAILVFLIVTILFCRPVLEGNMLSQGDIDGWRGIANSAFEYKEQHGHYPLWNPNVFSGMPNYLIVMDGKSIIPDSFTKFITLGLPEPINQFFLACVCFYILCLSLGLRPVVGILGALAFAFATYNPIIIAAGHVTKMFAIAYMPLLLAGLINTFEKRYWLGLSLTTLGSFLQIVANHPQITYYLFIVIFAITLAYLVTWIRKKEWKHIAIAAGISVAGLLVGIMGNSLTYLAVKEYSKASIRGGKSVEIKGDSVKVVNNTGGLDTSYAFSYSLGKGETVTVLMPNAFGGNGRTPLPEDSRVYEKLVERGVPEGSAAQINSSLPKFWGNSDSTAGGPIYSSAIICVLALLAFVLYKHPLRWALLGVSILAVLMAWGRHLPGFNMFLFENLPLYDKFRAPSITMVIVQLTLPIAAVLGAQYLFFRENSSELIKKDFRKILYALGGLTVFLLLMYFFMDYSSEYDRQIANSRFDNSGTNVIGNAIVSALEDERKAMFLGQVFRTIGFIAIVLGALWLHMKKVMQPIITVSLLALVILIDLLVVDKDYLNEDNYRESEPIASTFVKTPIDQQILTDTSKHYRVFSQAPDRFSQSDYRYSIFHKAVGGYHPAKLRLYNDVITRYLSGGADPRQVLNMLNTKYVIMANEQGQESVFTNGEAYGPAWFVKSIKVVADDAEELQSLGTTNLRDTAVIQQSLVAKAGTPQWDSSATIRLSKFDPDEIEYTTQSTSPQFAVFSEVYYPYGWNAYIDGKKSEYIRTNYVLRGLAIPAGQHTVRFVFEPSTVKTGATMMYVGSYLIVIFVLGGLFMHYRQKNRTNPPVSTAPKK